MENRAITVSVFNNYISNIISSEEMLVNISIVGEICDLSVRNGIAYFSIKDAGALLNCVCFLETTFKKIKNGTQSVVVGSPQFYVKGGRFNFKVAEAFIFGKGNAFLKLMELKEKLQKKGYFDVQNKKQIPKFSQKIGVLTSEKGAVLQDIKSVSFRRNPYVKIVLLNVNVQGQLAETDIVNGLKILDDYGCDVIIIARGGGSEEDLSVFNSEKIADQIFSMQTPIVSAIGHETNFTICDLVADARAETPSSATEIVVFDFEKLKNRFFNAYVNAFENAMKDLNIKKQKLNIFKNSLNYCLENLLLNFQNSLEVCKTKLNNLSPYKILKQGYAYVSKQGSRAEFDLLQVGDELKIKFFDGEIIAKITKKEN